MESLFPDFENEWQKEWKEMPEYVNEKKKEPKQTVIFKFKTNEDFNKFMEVVKKELFNNERVFDGNQLKNKKTAWYPLPERPSKHIYINLKK